MRHARLNARFLFGTLGTGLIVIVLVSLLHSWQMQRHARGQLALANQAEQDNQTPELLAALNRYLGFDPRNQAVRSRYALTLADRSADNRQRWRAMQLLRQLVTQNKATPEVRHRAVELALTLGEPDEALSLLQPLLRAQPDRAELHELAARCQVARGKFGLAADALQQAVQLAPDKVDLVGQLADMLRTKLGQTRQGDALLDRLVRDHPRSVAAWLARARYRAAGELLSEAAADLHQARELAPRDADVLATSADVALRQGNAEQASSFWQQALTLVPDRPAFYAGRARAELAQGKGSQALLTLKHGLSQLPGNVELLMALAELHATRGENADARKLINQLSPNHRGLALYLAGRLGESEQPGATGLFLAERAYLAALDAGGLTEEQASQVLLRLANCYANLELPDLERQALERATQLTSRPQPRLRLARLLVDQGATDALAQLQALTRLPIPPAGAWTLLARALIERDRVLPAMQRNYQEIDQALAHATAPEQAGQVVALRAELLELRGDQEGARKLLEGALGTRVNQQPILLALADLNWRQGETGGALALLRRLEEVPEHRLEHVLAIADWLADHPGAGSDAQLVDLERHADTLAPAERDRVLRHLIRIRERTGTANDVRRLSLEFLKRHPNDVGVRLSLALARLQPINLDPAEADLRMLEQLQGREGLQSRTVRAALLLTRAERGEKVDLSVARQLVAAIGRQRPAWPLPLVLLGRLEDHEGHADQALTSYRQAFDLGDESGIALRRCLQLLGDRQRYVDAAELLEQAMRRGMLTPDLRRSAAELLLRGNKPDWACELARTCVPANTRSSRDLVWLGRIFDRAGRPTEAADYFRAAIRLTPAAPEPWLVLQAHYVKQQRPDDARATLEEMRLRLGPERAPLALAQADEVLGHFSRAEAAYKQLAASNPREVDARARLLALYLRLNRPLEAEPVLRALLAEGMPVQDEERPELRRQLALVLSAPEQRADRIDEALAWLAQNRYPTSDAAADRRVEALVRGMRPSERSAALRTFQSLPASAHTVPEEQLRLAQILDADGNWAAARNRLLALVQHDPENPGLLTALIDGLLRHKKLSEAGEWLTQLEKIEPGSPRVQEFRKVARP